MNNSNLVKFMYPQHIMDITKKESLKTYNDVYVPRQKLRELNTLIIKTAKDLKQKEIPEANFFKIFYNKISNLLDMGHESAGGLVYNELANFGKEFTKLLVKGSLVKIF